MDSKLLGLALRIFWKTTDSTIKRQDTIDRIAQSKQEESLEQLTERLQTEGLEDRITQRGKTLEISNHTARL